MDDFKYIADYYSLVTCWAYETICRLSFGPQFVLDIDIKIGRVWCKILHQGLPPGWMAYDKFIDFMKYL